MNEVEFRTLMEASWRGPLTEEDRSRLEAWLALHPVERAEWEMEEALNRSLAELPDAPLSSNFTSQVMLAIQREVGGAQAQAAPSLGDRIRAWLRPAALRVGWALVLVAAAWLGYHQHLSKVRADVARGVVVFANVATLSGPGALRDFDAIQLLNQVPPAEDEELYAVLNQ